jgi:hypothetical protein
MAAQHQGMLVKQHTLAACPLQGSMPLSSRIAVHAAGVRCILQLTFPPPMGSVVRAFLNVCSTASKQPSVWGTDKVVLRAAAQAAARHAAAVAVADSVHCALQACNCSFASIPLPASNLLLIPAALSTCQQAWPAPPPALRWRPPAQSPGT